MEMEDHHHHQQYNMATDLRQLVMNGAARSSTHFPTAEQLFSGHRNLVTPDPPHPHPHQQQHYEMMMLMPRGVVLDDFPTTTTTNNDSVTVTVPPTQAASNPEATGYVGGDASTGRWPRQETLSLLEIRSRLDPKFKDANQKGPLWDEVSRMMYEEHGYQRSGKKCREKFENLYKYYKKTKEGKAGRHDGKHYRFFRQLEALYGENSNHIQLQVPSQTNNNNKHCDSLSLTNSTDIDTSSSSEDNDSDVERRNKRKRKWMVKIKDFIDSQMKMLVEKQEEWLEKLVKTMEEKEKERMLREEEWREQEAKRLEREHKFWAKERAWIEARDVALMEALQNITTTTSREINIKAEEAEAEADHHHDHHHEDGSEILGGGGGDSWKECEITRLQQLRSEILLETNSEEEVVTWERVANKMACFGYERSALMCKEKWESIIRHYNIPRDDDSSKDIGNSNKKRINTCFYFNNNNDHQSSSIYNNQGSTYCDLNNDQRLQTNNGCSSPSNSNAGNVNAPGDTCFQFLMSDGGNLWENYLKINKANQNH